MASKICNRFDLHILMNSLIKEQIVIFLEWSCFKNIVRMNHPKKRRKKTKLESFKKKTKFIKQSQES